MHLFRTQGEYKIQLFAFSDVKAKNCIKIQFKNARLFITGFALLMLQVECNFLITFDLATYKELVYSLKFHF